MYEKIEFILRQPDPQAFRARSSLRFSAVRTDEDLEQFRAGIDAILDGSLDSADVAALANGARTRAVSRLCEPDEHFVWKREWWSLARNEADEVIGITQPVLFSGSERDGRWEGTHHYIGVLPAFRGKGYIDELVRHATERLASIGVWQIYTDTDINNRPMQNAFKRVGYTEGRVRKVSIPT